MDITKQYKTMLYLVCGYKRTGKDTLVKMYNSEKEFNWDVYKNSNNNKKFTIKPVIRIGLADNIRKEVNKMLDISKVIDYDTFKETVVKDGKTYRDILIEHGAYRRGQDIDYWIESALDPENTKGKNVMVTDWRFSNELDYVRNTNVDVTTIRLFRSEVPIPQGDIISEHQLDGTLTDFLLIPKTDTNFEFDEACRLFPQYKKYTKYNMCTKDCFFFVILSDKILY